MLERLLTEQRNPASSDIDTQPTQRILQIINSEDANVAAAITGQIPAIAAAVDRIVEAVSDGGRVFYIGAGTSGRLGVLDAAECPPTYSVPPELIQGIIAGGESALARATEASEDDPDAGARDLLGRDFTSKDVLVGLAASGRTPYVLGAVRKARELGATTAGISCTSKSELSLSVDLPIEVLVGPEVVTGSTRMKAGTATKLVLNMISTATMIRLGYIYSNLMVNVQPRNHKLIERAKRIIAEAAGVNPERAAKLLAEAGDVKTAIVMGKRDIDKPEAEELLRRSKGVVGRALQT